MAKFNSAQKNRNKRPSCRRVLFHLNLLPHKQEAAKRVEDEGGNLDVKMMAWLLWSTDAHVDTLRDTYPILVTTPASSGVCHALSKTPSTKARRGP
jgi:hypothetical protein